MATSKPTGLVQAFGDELKHAREQRGLTQEQLGQKIAYSRGQVGMVETGQRRIKEPVVRQLDELLGTDGLLLRLWRKASREATATRIADLMAFQENATLIRVYNPTFVPGLLQTEDYIRGLFSAGLLSGADAESIEAEVQQRLARQALLTAADPPRYTVVLYEAVLHGLVEDPKTMTDQLAHLLLMGTRRRVSIQILPFVAAKYAAVAPLVIVDAGRETLVHMESAIFAGFTTMDSPTVDEAREAFDLLRAQAAPTDASIEMIRARMEEIQHD